MKKQTVLFALSAIVFLVSPAAAAKEDASEELARIYRSEFKECVGKSSEAPDADLWENCNNKLLEKEWEKIPACAELEWQEFAGKEFSEYLEKSGALIGSAAKQEEDSFSEEAQFLTEHVVAKNALFAKLLKYNEAAVTQRVQSVPKEKYSSDLWVKARVDISKKCKGAKKRFDWALLVHSMISINPKEAL